jgi:hypothetical protein
MTHLHNFVELQFLCNVGVCLPGKQTGNSAKSLQFIVADIVPIFLCEQILVDPIPATFGDEDGAVEILAKPLFEDAPPKSSAWPSITCRMAAQSSASLMSAFRAALENQAVLKTRCDLSSGSCIFIG